MEDSKTASEHINLKVTGKDDRVVHFKIKKNTPLRKLMGAFCKRACITREAVRFCFDGNPIEDEDTPAVLEMEDGDSIDVRQQHTGQTATAKPRRADLAAVLKVGDKVRRGLNWTYGNQDGGGPGTVTAIPSRRATWPGCVDVRWDNGCEHIYRMGAEGCYDLDLV